jgi:hypothetical protein
VSVAAARGLPAEGAQLPDVVVAMRQARTDLEAAAEIARAGNDPLAPVLAGLSSSLGAMVALQARIEANKEPLDAKAQADMTRQLVQACRGDFVRQVATQSGRLAVLSGVGAALLIVGALGGGYQWGRSTEVAEVREASGVIRAALSGGSASARAWADAIRRNDLVGLLGRCEGRAVWADAGGRRACAVPLWLEDAPPPPTPAGPRPL